MSELITYLGTGKRIKYKKVFKKGPMYVDENGYQYWQENSTYVETHRAGGPSRISPNGDKWNTLMELRHFAL